MTTSSSLQNNDTNTNQGGYVGEIEASLGGFDLSNMGASTSSATSSSSVNFGGFGEINLASGKSTAGNTGIVKSVAFAILAIAGYAVFAYFSREKGGK